MTERTCSIPDCGRPYRSKGYCQGHYTKLRKYGDPLGGKWEALPAAGQTCTVEDCDRAVRCRQLCRTHYDRLRATGRFDRRTDAERFWSFTKVGSEPTAAHTPVEGPCILWAGALNATTGYGNFYLQGEFVMAHRAGYQLSTGAIPNGHHVDHLCRTRACVNPEHLEAVTPAENRRRAIPFR